MKINIRPEQKSEKSMIHSVNKIAFKQSNEAALVDALRKTGRFVPGLSLTAKYYEKTVGHILFYPVDIVNGDRHIETLALASMAVLPEYQKKGVGSKLVKVGLGKAKQLGYRSVIVRGHPKYYPKFGFQPAGKWNIKALLRRSRRGLYGAGTGPRRPGRCRRHRSLPRSIQQGVTIGAILSRQFPAPSLQLPNCKTDASGRPSAAGSVVVEMHAYSARIV
jgi:putative acetyltransferase